MSVNITTSFVEQYSANVSLLAQQTGSANWDKRNPAHTEAVEEVAALIRKKNNEEDVE